MKSHGPPKEEAAGPPKGEKPSCPKCLAPTSVELSRALLLALTGAVAACVLAPAFGAVLIANFSAPRPPRREGTTKFQAFGPILGVNRLAGTEAPDPWT